MDSNVSLATVEQVMLKTFMDFFSPFLEPGTLAWKCLIVCLGNAVITTTTRHRATLTFLSSTWTLHC